VPGPGGRAGIGVDRWLFGAGDVVEACADDAAETPLGDGPSGWLAVEPHAVASTIKAAAALARTGCRITGVASGRSSQHHATHYPARYGPGPLASRQIAGDGSGEQV
jgi:hypothetical protein